MNAINKSNRFPVAIQGEGFVDATYSDGVWTIGWDAASIQSIGVGEDPGEFLSYNEATETYGRVSFADTPTATAGTDTTQPVHSAGVAAAITARTPAAFAAWFDSLPTDPTGLSVGDWFNNGGIPCRIEA